MSAFKCSKVDIVNERFVIGIEFMGEDEWDNFLVLRHFEENDFGPFYYIESSDISGYFSQIQVILEEHSITFSMEGEKISIHLDINPKKHDQIRRVLKKLLAK